MNASTVAVISKRWYVGELDRLGRNLMASRNALSGFEEPPVIDLD